MKLSKTLLVVFILIVCINTFGKKDNVELETGTYFANARETLYTPFFDRYSGPFSANIKIKINSIDKNGNVKAEVIIASRKGKCSGKVDSDGKLELAGTLVGGDRTLWETKFKATVKDDSSLIQGKYISTASNGNKITGEFSKAIVIEEEEDW